MKGATLWQVSVATSREAEDAVVDLLGNIFHAPVASHLNAEDQVSRASVFGTKDGIFQRGIRKIIAAGLKRIADCGLSIDPGTIQLSKVRREDWAESWKRHFHPLEIGRRLLVRPSWSRRKGRKGQAMLTLDPGLSFGTGQHPTTAFCLHETVRLRRPAATQSFLDVGTGSGILALSAAKLGYKPVRAIDFDPVSVQIARTNARVNGLERKIIFSCGDAAALALRPRRQFDVVCANLISNLLVTERRRIAAQVKPGGTLVLAGVLNTEFQQVKLAFEPLGLKLSISKKQYEWRSGSFCLDAKRNPPLNIG